MMPMLCDDAYHRRSTYPNFALFGPLDRFMCRRPTREPCGDLDTPGVSQFNRNFSGGIPGAGLGSCPALAATGKAVGYLEWIRNQRPEDLEDLKILALLTTPICGGRIPEQKTHLGQGDDVLTAFACATAFGKPELLRETEWRFSPSAEPRPN